jgi:hypothetical protein
MITIASMEWKETTEISAVTNIDHWPLKCLELFWYATINSLWVEIMSSNFSKAYVELIISDFYTFANLSS